MNCALVVENAESNVYVPDLSGYVATGKTIEPKNGTMDHESMP